MTARAFLPAIPKLLQICGEPLHLLLEWFAVVLGGLRADVTPRPEHMAVLADVVVLRSLAETRDILIERWIPFSRE
jgi:hypothetical protein